MKDARKLEMKFFNDVRVYDVVERSMLKQVGGNLIRTRWIDVNKGDVDNPNIRCRLLVKELRTIHDDALFASTPPLGALRCIVTRAATVDSNGQAR